MKIIKLCVSLKYEMISIEERGKLHSYACYPTLDNIKKTEEQLIKL